MKKLGLLLLAAATILIILHACTGAREGRKPDNNGSKQETNALPEEVPKVGRRPQVPVEDGMTNVESVKKPEAFKKPGKPVRSKTNTTPGNKASFKNMVLVKGGWTRMILDSTAQNYKKVYVDSFYIDKYEVSNRDFGRFIKAGGYSDPRYWSKEGWEWRKEEKITTPRWWESSRYNAGKKHPDHPVACVSWYEADAYARWAGKRLPTEAEWHKASRGSTKQYYPWGNHSILHNGKYYANFDGAADGYKHSAKVDAFSLGKSPVGCYNMLGNVWEWVQDWKPTWTYYKNMPKRNPPGRAEGAEKILRGGSWYKNAGMYDIAFRLYAKPGSRAYDDIGFRCAADLP